MTIKSNNSTTTIKYIIMKNVHYFTLVVAAFFLMFSKANAQKQFQDFEYKKGDIEVSAGIGLVPTFINIDADVRIPPLSVMLGYRIKQHINIGAYFGYSSTKQTYQLDVDKDINEYAQNDFYLVGLRFEGHFQRDRADFYGGAMIGYNFSKISFGDSEIPRGDNRYFEEEDLVTYSGFVGMKYLVNEKVGLFGEVGYGVSLVNLGLSYKF